MGGSTSSSSSSSQDITTQYTTPTASAGEQTLRAELAGLSDDQIRALTHELDQWGPGSSVLSTDANTQRLLDQAAQPQLDRYVMNLRDQADAMAGSRGLRLSDTPIAERVLGEFGGGMAGLAAGRATSGLGLGLASHANRTQNLLGLTGAIPGGAASLGQNYLQERLASGTQRQTGWSTNTMNQSSDNLNQNIATGASVAAAAGTVAIAI